MALDMLLTQANTAHTASATLTDIHSVMRRVCIYIIMAANTSNAIIGAVDMLKWRHTIPPANERHIKSGRRTQSSLNGGCFRYDFTGRYARKIPGMIMASSSTGRSKTNIIRSLSC